MAGESKQRPIRVRFLYDDDAELWLEGATGDDLGPEHEGSSARIFRLDGFDESLVVLEDPYARGIVERLLPPEEGEQEEDIPFEGKPDRMTIITTAGLEDDENWQLVDPADRCARCSHVAAQHMWTPVSGKSSGEEGYVDVSGKVGSCGACGCMKFVSEDTGGEA